MQFNIHVGPFRLIEMLVLAYMIIRPVFYSTETLSFLFFPKYSIVVFEI